MAATYDRQLLALTATDLEKFVRDWALEKKASYFKVEVFSGSGDRGRDVVCFVDQTLHEGDWDNFQCKQYGKTLPTASYFHEIGKILYYASLGEFTPPRTFSFVAPKGVNRNLQRLLFKPIEFKQAFIAGWNEHCEHTIIDGASVPLTLELTAFIEAYDFSRIGRIGLEDLLGDPAAKPVLYKWFGADPGPAPLGATPDAVQEDELPYISQLLAAYSERAGVPIADHQSAATHPQFGTHLARQRERFYDADAFKRFYRDNTDAAAIEAFESDIYHGVVDTCDGPHADALGRADAVMSQAAAVQPSGVLAQHSRVHDHQDIALVREAALVEIAKIRRQAEDLAGTLSTLRDEQSLLGEELPRLTERLGKLEADISDLTPQAAQSQSDLGQIVAARDQAQRGLALLAQREELTRRRDGYEGAKATPKADRPVLAVAGSITHEFTQIVSGVLKQWGFPGEHHVSFDDETYDLKIDGKARVANGKGVRAVTHAAFKVALLLFCRQKGLLTRASLF